MFPVLDCIRSNGVALLFQGRQDLWPWGYPDHSTSSSFKAFGEHFAIPLYGQRKPYARIAASDDKSNKTCADTVGTSFYIANRYSAYRQAVCFKPTRHFLL
jgi:hypothetical protein